MILLNALDALRRDAGFALRSFAKSPGFTAAVTASIAAGIAANAVVFSLVNGLLLGSLPVREPERLLAFNDGRTFSYPDYCDYRDQTGEVFEGVAAHLLAAPASVGGSGEPERVWGQLASANYFAVAGVEPALGRAFLAEEDQAPGRNPVVVLGHGLWQRRFGGDSRIVGQPILLNGAKFTVIGVAPAGFTGTTRGLVPEFWAPLSMLRELMPDLARDGIAEKRFAQWLTINVRLKPGVSREQALAAVNVVKQRIDSIHRKDEKRKRPPVTLTPAGRLLDGMSRRLTGLLGVLMAVVGLVLLIVCANVANLLLARAAGRQKEMGVRLAVGAGRGTLIRQLLVESVLLALLGAAGGFLLAWAAAGAISQFRLPLPIPIVFDFSPDLRVLAFTGALALVTGVVFGLAPALRATRPDLVSALKDTGTGFGSFRRFGMRNLLVVVQVSLSLVLLIGAGLFLRSLRNAASIDIGMRPDNVLLMAFDPKLHNYSSDRTRRFLTELRERVAALPGVTGVTYVDSLPLSIGGTSFGFKAEGVKDAETVNADVYQAGSGFFDTMGMRLVRGRDFRPGDTEAALIINETMAGRLFGREDALGRYVSTERPSKGPSKLYQVVGVARNAKSRTLGEEPVSCAYLYLEAAPENVMSFYGITIAARTGQPPRRMERAVRERIHALDPGLAVFNADTMQEHVDKAFLLPRICATLLGVFGGAGLLLATIGLYGVMSYGVRGRRREIGIRMALGAPAGGVLRMVIAQGLALVLAGVAVGMAAAYGLSRFAASLLYGISATDGVTFLAVPLVLVAVAFLAVLAPARRAAAIDPMNALRYE